jgi:glycosyltransferase involved in cell wall biosynthesis
VKILNLIQRTNLRAAILFHRIGPYHFARARAAGRRMNATLIEVFISDDVYSWDQVPGEDGFNRVTLFEKNSETGEKLVRGVQSALENCRPDAVAIPGWADAVALGAMQWCGARRIPVVVMSETTEWDEPRLVWKEWIKRRILRMCAAGLVGGRPQAEYLARLGMPTGSIFQGYDAVDNEYFAQKAQAARIRKSEVAKKNGLPENYFLASARFIDKKNLFNLVRAFALYRKMVKKTESMERNVNGRVNGHSSSDSGLWSLVLLGDGPLKSELSSLIVELGLQESILLPGFKQYDELPAFYALAKVFIHASTVEQWGLVVNEAMASGLPVLISNRCGCACDLVQEDVNGFTFDPYDPAQMAELMFRISDSGFPLSGFGTASSRIIAEWSPDRFADGLSEAIDTALTTSPVQLTPLDHLLLQLLLKR